MFEHAIRTGRLRKLAALGLAEQLGSGRWRLAEEFEPMLRSLGERGDIIRMLQRELKSAGVERGLSDQLVYRPEAGTSVTGCLVARGLADEVRDHHYLVIDGIDGRSHYVAIGKGEATGPLPDGAIVRISARAIGVRSSDERIAAIATAHGGRYSIDLHLAAEPGASPGFAEAHVRRLEAIRRSVGGVERAEDGSWSIPPGFVDLAGRHEARLARDRAVEVELLSPVPLDRLPKHEGATWLDRELVAPGEQARDAGFGREVRSSLALRRAWLIEQGLASLEGERATYRPGLLTRLEKRELARVTAGIRQETGLEFAPAEPGARVEGVVRRRLDLASGRFAMIDNGREFSLVPWRPVLERALGRPVSGLVRRDGRISWTLGRERGLDVG